MSKPLPLAERLQVLALLGRAMQDFEQRADFDALATQAYLQNNWFTEPNVRLAWRQAASALTTATLADWAGPYGFHHTAAPKAVGIIAAGNVPLVGWADVLAVLVAGHKAHIKLSTQDTVLMLALLGLLAQTAPELYQNVAVAERLANLDAIIATGGNNSARYFHAYFGKYPHIIRQNRNSVALLTGTETDAELAGLGQDVCLYFGLGCRSVSCLLLPEGYDIALLAKAWLPFAFMTDHHKYANNLDYHRAIFLMNQDPFLDMGVVLLRAEDRLYSPLSVLNLVYYKNKEEAKSWLAERQAAIQVVVGPASIWPSAIAFGQAQHPTLADYADGIDTLAWLQNIA